MLVIIVQAHTRVNTLVFNQQVVSEPRSCMTKCMPKPIMSSSSSSNVDDTSSQRIGKDGVVTLHYLMLTKTNYSVWALKMRVNLQAQGVWAAIYQALPEDVLMMLAEKDTDKEAWETLRTMHMGAERVKEAKVQTLRSDFEVIRMKDSESVDDFAMRLNTIVTGIRSLGEKIEEITVVKKFLWAVPIRFMQIVTSIEQFGDLKNMTVEEVVGRLKTHEERLRGFGDREREPSLLLTHAEWSSHSKRTDEKDSSSASRGREGFRGRGRGRGRRRGRGRDGDREPTANRIEQIPLRKHKSKIKCFTCEKFGHYASECPNKKHGEEANLTQTEDEELTLMMAIAVRRHPTKSS